MQLFSALSSKRIARAIVGAALFVASIVLFSYSVSYVLAVSGAYDIAIPDAEVISDEDLGTEDIWLTDTPGEKPEQPSNQVQWRIEGVIDSVYMPLYDLMLVDGANSVVLGQAAASATAQDAQVNDVAPHMVYMPHILIREVLDLSVAPQQVPAPIAMPTQTAIPTQIAVPTQLAVPARIEIPTRIEIPSIKVDSPIIDVGWNTVYESNRWISTWEVADYAVGFHRDSVTPGKPGNTVLSGHNNIKGEVFRYLGHLRVGDPISVYVGEREYKYVVTKKVLFYEPSTSKKKQEANMRWIERTEDERLTLVSCFPYSSNTQRLIIVAMPEPG